MACQMRKIPLKDHNNINTILTAVLCVSLVLVLLERTGVGLREIRVKVAPTVNATHMAATPDKPLLFHDKGRGSYRSADLNCSVPWRWTDDETAADAVIYNVLDNGREVLDPSFRLISSRPEQVAVFFSLECGLHHPAVFAADQLGFNVSMDYRIWGHPNGRADVPLVYLNNSLVYPPRGDLRRPPHMPKSTDALMSAFMSNCAVVRNNRQDVLQQLIGEISVHSYGTCQHNKDEPNPEDGAHLYDVKRDLMAKYLFYFAAENANDPGYVTEKVYHALEAGTVPVYLGAPDIDRFVPDSSAIIRVSDFNSTAELAAHLRALAADEARYMKHFEWKQREYSDDFKQVQRLSWRTAMCGLARHLAGVPN